MNICIVTHRVVKGDGQGRANYEVVREALRRGYTVTALATEAAPDLSIEPGFRWVPVPVSGPTQMGKNLLFARRSARWLQRHRPAYDLVKVNGSITSAAADVNAVHFVHSSWLRSPVHTARLRPGPYGWYQWLYTALNARWERQALLQARLAVAVSPSVQQDLIAMGIPPERIRVIANGVDLQEFAPGPGDRSPWNLPSGPLALFVGDIQTPRKNLDGVLQALGQVPGLQVAIAGRLGGSPYPAMAEQLGVAERVHFLDHQTDIPALMRAADFLVFPSRYETFGLVILEAMASGLPVITAPTAGAASLVSPDTGIVLDHPDQVTQLAAAMARLSDDAALRQRLGAAARTAASHHSWRATAAAYVDCFESLQSMGVAAR